VVRETVGEPGRAFQERSANGLKVGTQLRKKRPRSRRKILQKGSHPSTLDPGDN